ncbi:carboxylating nicotinate-nucleotide diphosphorylase [Metabacillus sp. GX 13764]|uniref:carboxylating nicotinate-nucleotide diphosphorylase n=1 Tax=Metabacillus kandeliae TaxID=2900151 RepID=UPI001E5B2226|nr:carboxylating nicotinate-nucleotide diphosphorylase [Metabacillus kandeliae]MCD7032941.1 carboxylating nicotinate-nucleotide diphosphorylase [Metabacillus kandeliae]
MNELKLKKLLEQFFIEDIGDGDLSSSAIFGEKESGEAIILAKEDGIFSGGKIIAAGFQLLEHDAEITLYKQDGEPIHKGEKIAAVQASVRTILSCERVILNLIQRMSGIATAVYSAVKQLDSEHTKITDTRKTVPGLRMLDKYAVRCGGGKNHRFGLYDAIMIKDNHIDFCGSITEAVKRARSAAGHNVKIEVEIETEEQLMEAIEAKADIIMFDNRSPEEVKRFAALTPDSIITEASGGIHWDELPLYGKTGVGYISLGYLTHSVKALDISLYMKNTEKVKEEAQ